MISILLQDKKHKNKIYRSIRSAISDNRLKKSTVYNRIQNGMDENAAFSAPIRKYTTDRIIYDGKSFHSFRELCKFYNVSELIVRSRLKAGYNLDEALKTQNLKSVTINNQYFNTIKTASEFYNISVEILRYRIRNILKKRDNKNRVFSSEELNLI